MLDIELPGYWFDIGILIILVAIIRYLMVIARTLRSIAAIQLEPAVTWWWRQVCPFAEEKRCGEITLKLDVCSPPGRPITLTLVTFELSKYHRRTGVQSVIVDVEGDVIGADSNQRNLTDGFLAIWRELSPGETASILVTIRFANLGSNAPSACLALGKLSLYYLNGGSRRIQLAFKTGIPTEDLPYISGGGHYIATNRTVIPGYDVSESV